jgi:hypothetical protein
LLRERYEPKDLFDEVKLKINLVGGTLSGDDTVVDKLILEAFFYAFSYEIGIRLL